MREDGVINIRYTRAGCKNDVIAYEIHRNSWSTNYDAIVNIPNDNNISHVGVKTCTWNINGLTNEKLHDGVLGKFLKHFDIIMLSETWTHESDNFTMSGYQYHNTSSKEKHGYAKRNSGGLKIYIRNNIANGVEVSKIVNNDFMMWIKLKKDFFNLCNDVCIENIYIVAEGSMHRPCTCQVSEAAVEWCFTNSHIV